MNNTYLLIMAGGEGVRFAPLSTPDKPKQFLNFFGEGTFIQQAKARVENIVPSERIYVATNERYLMLVREQLPEIPVQNIIMEPQKKNTAPCIAYAARLISERDPEAVMIVFPSDHVILKRETFRKIIMEGIDVVRREDCLLTLGIKPEWPASEYGYIKSGNSLLSSSDTVCKIDSFVEKPDELTAGAYIDEGCYFWNSGIFLWKAKSLLDEVQKYLPRLAKALDQYKPNDEFRRKFFTEAESISIDYGVLEKSGRTAVIPCDIGWSDVGTWEGLYRLSLKEEIRVEPSIAKRMREQLGYVPPLKENKLPRRVDKPWGYEEIWAHTKDYVGKILKINKDQRLSYQYHRVKEETIRILAGIMDLEFESCGKRSTVRLRSGDVYHIPPRTNHRMTAIDDCSVLEVSTPYLEDVVRIEDDYGRKEISQ